MARELVEALDREIADTEARLAWLKEVRRKEGLRKETGTGTTVPPGVLDIEGKLIRKPTTTWKPADAIERLLEGGAKTMKREALIKVLVDQKLVGKDADDRRPQYADIAIEKGLKAKPPYLKEDRDTTIHWISGARKSRVSKRR